MKYPNVLAKLIVKPLVKIGVVIGVILSPILYYPAFGDNPEVTVVSKQIGMLKTQHNIVEILSGSEGPRYNIKALSGDLLAKGLSIDKVQDQFPQLYKLIEAGVADDASLSPDMPRVDSGEPALDMGY